MSYRPDRSGSGPIPGVSWADYDAMTREEMNVVHNQRKIPKTWTNRNKPKQHKATISPRVPPLVQNQISAMSFQQQNRPQSSRSTDTSALTAKIAQLERALADVALGKDRLDTENQQLKTELASMTLERDALLNENQQLKAAPKPVQPPDRKHEIESLKAQLESAKQQCDQHHKTIRDITAERDDLKKRMEAMQSVPKRGKSETIAPAKTSDSDFQQRIIDKDEQITQMEQTLKENDAEISRLQSKLAAKNTQPDEQSKPEKRKGGGNSAKSNVTIEQSTAELDEVKKQCDKHLETITRITAERDDLKSRLAADEARIRDLEAAQQDQQQKHELKSKQLESQIKEARENGQQSVDMEKKSQMELCKLKSEHQNELTKQQAEVTKLQATIRDMTTQISVLEQSKKASLVQAGEQIKKTTEKGQAKYIKLKADYEALASKHATLQSQLKADHETLTTNHATLQAQFNDVSGQLAKLQTEHDTMKGHCQDNHFLDNIDGGETTKIVATLHSLQNSHSELTQAHHTLIGIHAAEVKSGQQRIATLELQMKKRAEELAQFTRQQ